MVIPEKDVKKSEEEEVTEVTEVKEEEVKDEMDDEVVASEFEKEALGDDTKEGELDLDIDGVGDPPRGGGAAASYNPTSCGPN